MDTEHELTEAAKQEDHPGGVFEKVLSFVKEHAEKHPDHGSNCACLDEPTRWLRQAYAEAGLNRKAKSFLWTIINYLNTRL